VFHGSGPGFGLRDTSREGCGQVLLGPAVGFIN